MGSTLRKFVNLELMIVTCGEANSGADAGLFKEEKKCRRKWEVLSDESLLQGLLSTLRPSKNFLPPGLRLPSLSGIGADENTGDQKQMVFVERKVSAVLNVPRLLDHSLLLFEVLEIEMLTLRCCVGCSY